MRFLLGRLRARVGVGALCLAALCSCSDDEDNNTYDSYQNWEARNTEWFDALVDSAQAEMAAGSNDWRVCTSTSLNGTEDNKERIVMRMVRTNPDGAQPLSNDTVRINYRGWLMSATYRIDGRDTTYCKVFDQSFYDGNTYGPYTLTPFDDATAAPSKSAVNSFVDGFATALQYMREGEQCHLYIPAYLAYGSSGTTGIPGGSTLHFFVHLKAVYRIGETVPDWK